MGKITGKKYYGSMGRTSSTFTKDPVRIEDHHHSKVRRFSKAEIEEYERQRKQ